jgi:hypothetical protein
MKLRGSSAGVSRAAFAQPVRKRNIVSTTPAAQGTSTRWQPSEDWLATFIGLAVVVIIGSGLIGPGPQTITLSAPAAETREAPAYPASGWIISARIGEASAAVENSSSILERDSTTIIECQDARLSVQTANGAPAAGRAQIVLMNNCDQPVSVTYKTNAVIPWPVFRVFSQ